MSSKVILITGGTSGIGRCTALALQAQGCRVHTLSRRKTGLAGIPHICADVTEEAALQAAVQSLFHEEGSIDVLINCAGFGISGAIEFTELVEAKAQMEVNFFGMVNATRAVLPLMRRQEEDVL